MTVALVANIARPISSAISTAFSADSYGLLSSYGLLGASANPDAVIEALFANSEVGAWYDPSDLSTMFQDRAGTTPVTADGQTVGLILDKSQGLVLGSELVTNGDFSSGTTGWSGYTATIANVANELEVTLTTAAGEGNSAFTTVVGKSYIATADIKNVNATNVSLRAQENGGGYSILATSAISTSTSTTSVSMIFTATLTSTRIAGRVTGTSGQKGLFDNISVKELPGNHAVAPSDAARPLRSSRINILTKTEQFDNAVWSKGNLNAFGSGSVVDTTVTTDPLGGNTAEYIQENTANGTHYVNTASAFNAPTKVTARLYAKAGERTAIVIDFSSVPYEKGFFDLANGVTKGQNGGIVSIQSVGNGWYLCSVTATDRAHVNDRVNFRLVSNYAAATNTYTGDGVSGAYIWGASLCLAAHATLPYQRVNTSTDYDTVGFPKYTDYDAVDDVLNTTFPSSIGSSCTVAKAVVGGSPTILTGQTIGTTWAESTDNAGLIIINRALTDQETTDVTAWLTAKGAT